MRIHKEGYSILRNLFLILLIVNFLFLWKFSSDIQVKGFVLTLFLYLLVLQFFRNPKRVPVINDNKVISPADGTIVAIKEIFDDEYFNENRIKVSIFMSPLNVHVNWYPIGGKIKYAHHDIYNNSDAPEEATAIQTFYEQQYLDKNKAITYIKFNL